MTKNKSLRTLFNDVFKVDNYEESMDYVSSYEMRYASKLSSTNERQDELFKLLSAVVRLPLEEARIVLRKIVSERYQTSKRQGADNAPREILLSETKLNNVRYVNRYLRRVNGALQEGGLYVCCFDSYLKRKVKIRSRYPRFISDIVIFFDFLWNRVCPKLIGVRKFYYWCSGNNRKVFPRTEVLGRLCYCGFEVVGERYYDKTLFVLARKVREPSKEPRHYGMVIRLKRVGKNGKMFNVYKFRTMFAYSDYLQAYVYANNKLSNGGKFKDDYRIPAWGAWMRKYWVDELPMLFNLLKGDMKLVGVRPLSKHYFDLYDHDLQERRIKYKPGLLPPYYADMPNTLDEIQDSERRYLDAYEKNPLMTDMKYFFKIMRNIVFRRKRSK